MKINNKLISLVGIISIASSLFSPLSTLASYSSGNAQNYLSAHQGSPWVTMALSAINASNIQSDYLKSVSSNSAIDYEAPILAITSLGKDPRTFGATDYVAKLESFNSNNQIGDSSTVNDDIFGMLALLSAGEPASTKAVSDAKNFILAHQNQDGGWGFSTSSSSDSNTTASGIVALVADGVSSSDSHLQSALNYLKAAQNTDGGFTYDPQSQFGTASDSSSTSWAIWALNSLKIDPHSLNKSGGDPISYLVSTQADSGYFKYQAPSSEDNFSPVTTAYAVIALAGKTLPVLSSPPGTGGVPGAAGGGGSLFDFRIEGSANQICSGKAQGPTALDIVKNASVICGFTYHIKDTSYGPYLDQINSDTASGSNGWLYLVNNKAPDVGAGDYQLKTGDGVLWYFGDFTWQPAQLTLDNSSITTGGSVKATVIGYNSGNPSPLSGATVYYGASQATTGSDGTVQISPPDGYYKLYASKTGFVRSNTAVLQVGQSSSPSVNLTANLQIGQVQGTSTGASVIAFTVNPTNLDFGSLNPGQSASKNLELKNTGNVNITVQDVVSGDDIFKNGLTLGGSFWNAFNQSLNIGQTSTTAAKLTVPAGLTGSSHQITGGVVFWATAQ